MASETRTHRVVGINGGPRKNWNTARLLEEALCGSASQGAATELVHLYDLDFKGCRSCFHCKTRENYLNGRCAQRDGLSPVLELLAGSTALVMGSPIYLADVTGALRSFIERFVFINLAYDQASPSVLEKGPSVGLIYTMNIPRESLGPFGYSVLFKSHLDFFSRLNGPTIEQLASCDTLQFDDYSRFHAPMFDEAHKREVRERRFPEDLAQAFGMGVRLAAGE
ncbi:MAG: flavodoxin family protein [Deltaproteobacteria bacterium]|jgi:multimeric flavodoxin WrbA|nr:flavodoxin family protein [Deltaproteobacteria bacterium]